MCIPTCCRCTTPSANTFLFVFQWLVSGLSLSPSFSFPPPVFNRSCFFFLSYFCFITQLDEHEAQHTINCIEFIALRGDEIVLKTAITLSTFPLFRAAIIYPCVLSAFCLCVFFFFYIWQISFVRVIVALDTQIRICLFLFEILSNLTISSLSK